MTADAPPREVRHSDFAATKADLSDLEIRLIRELNARDWRIVSAVLVIVGIAVAVLKLTP